MAHNDVIVYEDIVAHLDTDEAHENHHHKNDSEEDKNTEHHHHCSIEFTTLIAIEFPVNQFQILNFSSEKTTINFYQNIYNPSYLDGVFQPPKQA